MKIKIPYFIPFLFTVAILFSCGDDTNYIPKPKGYFRIELPEKKYQTYHSGCPFIFQYPTYATPVERNNAEYPCWINLEFLKCNATLHLSYKNLQNDLEKCTEDSRTLAYKHTYKATDIIEQTISDSEQKKFGILYTIKGNVASSLQFHITDSSQHFLRGSLYFNTIPNADSIAPVLQFIEEDIYHFIETFNWK
ncbi:MAG: gliding motility lipoprotein GldD [Flavobacteriales bacterium]|nr:gliding motility lipoprotein GldD [Flavobacteriales bacterium]